MKKTFTFTKPFYLFDYLLFLLLMLFKLFIFADYTHSVFYKTGAIGYLKNILSFLFFGGPFKFLHQGLVMISLGFVLLASFWTLFLKQKMRLNSLFGLNLFFSFLLFSDLLYFRYFTGFISVTEFTQINQVASVSGSILSLIEWRDLLFWVDILLLIPFMLYLNKRVHFTLTKRALIPGIIALFVGWFFVMQPLNQFYQVGGRDVLKKMVSSETVYRYVGILGYHFFDAKRFSEDYFFRSNKVTAERKEEIMNWMETKEPHSDPLPSFGIAKGKNLIVVQVEALQNFVIDKKIDEQEITPFLNQLKNDSLYFNHFYHQTGQGRTSDADLLVNASLYPLSSGSVFTRFGTNRYHTLSNTLANQGYETAVHHAFKASFWNRNAVYSNWGYDHFYSQKEFSGEERIGWGLGDRDFLVQSVEQMPTNHPFYSFLITLTSHHPYHMPDDYKKLNIESVTDNLLQNYLHSIHYVDRALETFVKELKKKDLWDSSIVVFYGDHDAAVLEYGTDTAKLAVNTDKKVDFLQTQNQVPLFIHIPDATMNQTIEQTGGLIDIAPTLYHLLGIDPTSRTMMGQNLLENHSNLVVFRDGSFTDGEVWYQSSTDIAFENGECYDLSTSELTDIESCRQGFVEAHTRLELSDDIIYSNLLKEELTE